jgi:hypothetical protein
VQPRLLDAGVAAKFLEAELHNPKVKRFLSDEHFSVDGTLVEAWASLKSFRAKDGSAGCCVAVSPARSERATF